MNFYPRQLLRRDSFFSLDGLWTLNGTSIMVPYCPESPMSGYSGEITEELEYRKTFSLPDNFVKQNDKVVLHFQAVDQVCEVYLNEQYLGKNEGGYLPFAIDITEYLLAENDLVVKVRDNLSDFYPYGKQTDKPHGMWYTKVSGIWQSVWIEAYDRQGIDDLVIKATDHSVTMHIESQSNLFRVSFDGFTQEFTEHDILIEFENPHTWSPDDPYLYEIKIETLHDKVYSYFGLREVTVRNGIIYLNESPLFMSGLLDQGYYPEGILTATAEQIEKDIRNIKDLGFNTLRKHIKIENDAFYYYCDKYGILVLQDFVNSGKYSYYRDSVIPTIGFIRSRKPVTDKARYEFFVDQAQKTIKLLQGHPCLIGYTIYNEGWGQQAASDVYDILKPLDPNRLFDSTSGWFWDDHSDFDSYHIYFRKKVLEGKEKLLLLSEFGGYARSIKGHVDENQKTYGYGNMESEFALTEHIKNLFQGMVIPSISNGLVGCIYTQLSDVEGEINGLYTYDREVCKVNAKEIRELNREVYMTFYEYVRVKKQ